MLKVVRGPINHSIRAKTMNHFGHELYNSGQLTAALRCFVEARRSYRMLPEKSRPADIDHKIHRITEKLKNG